MSAFYQDIEGIIIDFDGVFWPLGFTPKEGRYKIFMNAVAETIISLSGTGDSHESIANANLSLYLEHREKGQDILCDQYGVNRVEFQALYNRVAYKNLSAVDEFSSIPCLKDALISLQRSPIRYGILSHAHKGEYIWPYLKDKGLDKHMHRDMIIGKGELRDYSKSDGPEAYIMMLSLLGTDPKKTLMIEDSPRNLIWAKRMQMKTLLLHDGEPENLDKEYEEYIDKKDDTLLNVLNKINEVHPRLIQFVPSGIHLKQS